MSRRNKNADNVRRTQYGKVTIYGIPYSEHSSFTELKRFVQFLKPAEVIPTVNVERSANAMTKYFRQWLSETPITSLKQRNERDQFVQQKMSRYFQSQMIPTDEDLWQEDVLLFYKYILEIGPFLYILPDWWFKLKLIYTNIRKPFMFRCLKNI